MGDGAPEIRVHVAGRSDVGCVRTRNEDNFCVVDLSRGTSSLPQETPAGAGGFLFLVCDGMGGHVAGQVASRLAVDMVTASMSASGPAPVTPETLARRLRAAGRRANARIFRAARENRKLDGMGTTMSAVALAGGTLVIAQVGDSRAYIVRGDQLVQVTRDQSLVEELIRTGQLSEVEAADFEHSNIILQALGVCADVDVALTRVALRRGDHLLVCSDGLSGVVADEYVRRTVSDAQTPDAACERLIGLARECGGPDNVTCVVARFEGHGLEEATPGSPVDHGPLEVPSGPEDDLGRDEGGAVAIPGDLLAEVEEAPRGAAWTMALPAIDPASLVRHPRRFLWAVLLFVVFGALGGAAFVWFAYRR